MPSGVSRPGVRGMPERSVLLAVALEPIVNSAGYDLEDLTVTRAGRRCVVRVIVDSDSGVDLDAVASLSRAISVALDDEPMIDVVDGAYQLEVSSPGVDRPLTEPRHWRRAVGRLVEVEVGRKQVTGRVLSADTAGVVLATAGDERSAAQAAQAVHWSELGPGRVQVEFNRGGGSTATAQTGEA